VIAAAAADELRVPDLPRRCRCDRPLIVAGELGPLCAKCGHRPIARLIATGDEDRKETT
jgi:hypothetical protein